MDDIRSIIQRAARRLFLIDLLRTLVFAGFIVLCALLAIRITQKLVPTLQIDWMLAALIGLGATLGLALIVSLVRRPDEDSVARTIDERAGLRESISTALCVDENKDNWSRAIVSDASQRARRVVVSGGFPRLTSPACSPRKNNSRPTRPRSNRSRPR